MLTKQGVLLESSREFIAPLAKLVSRSDIEFLKAYSINNEIRDVGRGTIIQSKASFSIFMNSSAILEEIGAPDSFKYREAEVLLVAIKLVRSIQKFIGAETVLEIANTQLISAIANIIELEDIDLYKSLVKLTACNYDKSKVEGDLWKLVKEDSKKFVLVSQLLSVNKKPFKDFKEKILSIVGSENMLINHTLEDMEIISEVLKEQVSECPGLSVLYSMCSLSYKRISYHAGMAFSLSTFKRTDSPAYNRKTMGTQVELMYGGRMDNLIEAYKPQDLRTRLAACSLVFKSQEIYEMIRDYCRASNPFPKIDIDVFNGTSVIVASKLENAQTWTFKVAAELWQQGIRAEVMIEPLSSASDKSANDYRRRGIQYLLIVKKKAENLIRENNKDKTKKKKKDAEERDDKKKSDEKESELDTSLYSTYESIVILRNFKGGKGEKGTEYSLYDAIQQIKSTQSPFDNFSNRREFDVIDSML